MQELTIVQMIVNFILIGDAIVVLGTSVSCVRRSYQTKTNLHLIQSQNQEILRRLFLAFLTLIFYAKFLKLMIVVLQSFPPFQGKFKEEIFDACVMVVANQIL